MLTERRFIGINLVIALIGWFFVFLIGIDKTSSSACKFVSIVLIFFILAAFAWVLIASHSFVTTFVRLSSFNMTNKIGAGLVGWAIPFVIAVIAVVVDSLTGNDALGVVNEFLKR